MDGKLNVYYVRDKSEQYPYCILFYGRTYESCKDFIEKLLSSENGYLWDRESLKIEHEEW